MPLPAIAGLSILLGIVLFLIVGALAFAFLKNIVIALVMGLIGGFLIWQITPSLEKKYGQAIFVIALFLILAGLFVGVAQPFSLVYSPAGQVTSGSLSILVSNFVGAALSLFGV